MSKFDRTICDCCVCSMQCILQQLEGDFVQIATTSRVGAAAPPIEGTLNSANNFIAKTSAGSVPICNITAVGIPFPESNDTPFDVNVKPIRNDKTGECSCCEDPVTNELNRLVGKGVDIEYIGDGTPFVDSVIIEKVGEGIVTVIDPGANVDGRIPKFAISTCYITKIEELPQ
ncbi:hypothetical protein [Chengkuizengella axinellae]|uniref:Spore coat protein n=1 Tax=Chengkuizengella axinellae TaxID=3064388 RepID=A0ABT9J6F8_9BACL|nr:hypothetical protein [Chengkuizengella sp. 2205SS18-9]MDP5277189.1 hypothetical protein [Chengkuizengella sp. 2205SS18-9]